MNHYRTLGIPFTASRKEIKLAFRQLAKECHPDLHPNDSSAAQKFQVLNEAYSTLYDPVLRRQYHRKLYERMRGGPTSKTQGKTQGRTFTPEEKAAFARAMQEEKRIHQLRKKVLIFATPTLTVIIWGLLFTWAWKHGQMSFSYGIIMLIASAFLALPPSALIWIVSFEILRKKSRKKAGV